MVMLTNHTTIVEKSSNLKESGRHINNPNEREGTVVQGPILLYSLIGERR